MYKLILGGRYMKNDNPDVNKFLLIIKPIEKVFLRIIVLFTCLLFISQLLLVNPLIRQHISEIDRIEGTIISNIKIIPESSQIDRYVKE
jgi:hypothetical protein